MLKMQITAKPASLKGLMQSYHSEVNKALHQAAADAKESYEKDTNPSTGRRIKSRRINRALSMKVQEISDRKPTGYVEAKIVGTRQVKWMTWVQEAGERIFPKKSKVLTLPLPGVGKKAQARQFTNAIWIPGKGGRRDQPLLYDKKRKRAVMVGRQSVKLTPKGFFKASFDAAAATVAKMLPQGFKTLHRFKA